MSTTELIPKAKENGNIRAMSGVSYLANFSIIIRVLVLLLYRTVVTVAIVLNIPGAFGSNVGLKRGF